RHPCRQAIVVAIADFGRRYCIVLVDDRHRTTAEKGRERRARIEITPAFLGVLEGDEHLGGDDATLAQCLRPGMGKSDLADGGCRLALFEAQRLGREIEISPAKCYCPGRYDNDLAALIPDRRNVFDERGEPAPFDGTLGRFDDERRADLND